METELPVLLFLDNHSSHFSIAISERCEELGIILITFFPNSTFLSQPLDVHGFDHIKTEWTNALHDEQFEDEHFRLNLCNFGKILEKICKDARVPSVLRKGFLETGVFPYNVDAIDFSKLSTANNKRSTESGVSENSPENLGFNTYSDSVNEEDLSRDFEDENNVELPEEMSVQDKNLCSLYKVKLEAIL